MKKHLQTLLWALSSWLIAFASPLSAAGNNSNTLQTAIQINANGELSGKLEIGAVLWYQVTLPDDGQWTINFEGQGDLSCDNLQLYDVSENIITTGTYGVNASVSFPNLGKGQYLLKLRYWRGAANTFILKSKFVNARLSTDTEPNDGVDNAIPLGLNGSSTGRLNYRNTDGTFDNADWYQITTTESGRLKINFTGDSTLRSDILKLYDTNKTKLLATGSWGMVASVSKDNLSPGTYYIYVPRYQGYGSYVLSSSFTEANLVDDIEPNDIQVNAQNVGLSDTINARLGYENGSTTDNADWYQLSIPENGTLKISFVSDNTLQINNPKIYTENGVLRNSSVGWGSNFNFSTVDLAKGDYWLNVPKYSGYGAYKFIAEFNAFAYPEDKESNNTFRKAIDLSNGQTVMGNLGHWRIQGDMDVEDWYKIVVPENAAVKFTVLTDSVLQINNPVLFSTTMDTISNRNTSPAWKYNFEFKVVDLSAGTYYLKVPRYASYGGYKMTYELLPLLLPNDTEPNNNFREATLINNKDTVTGHLGFWRQSFSDMDKEDWYKIVVPDNAAVKFTVLTDSVLQINNPVLLSTIMDTISVRNTSPVWKYNFEFKVVDLSAGTYYLKVPRYASYGSYKLTYELLPLLLPNDSMPNNNFREAALFNYKDTLTGHLGFWKQSFSDMDKEDWYKIIVTENAAIDFYFLTDSVLQLNNPVLYSAKMDSIEIKKTSPSWKYNFNFSIKDLTPGTYYLKIQRYAGYGSYSVSYKRKYYSIGFEVAQYNNMVKIVNKSNGDSFEWNFGDGGTSNVKFPEHTYAGVGDYEIVQKVKIEGSTTFWIAKDTVTIAGIESFSPKTSGNGGDMIMTIYGGGLNENTKVKLLQGTTVILPEKIIKRKLGMLEVLFDLHYADAGVYDVSVEMSGISPSIFEKSLTVEGIQYPHVVSSVEGYETLRTGRTWPYNLLLTNTGNVLARGVSAYIIVPDNVEFSSDLVPFSSTIDLQKSFDYHDDELNKNFSVSNVNVKATMDLLRMDYIPLDSLFGTPFKGKAYYIYAPVVQAGSTLKIPFKVKSLSQSSSDVSSIQSFVIPINMFGSCGSPMSYEMQNKMVDVMLAGIEKLPIVDKNPYFKAFIKVANLGKTAIRNASSYFGYLSAGMSEDEAFHEAYISEGQLDKANAEAITGALEWAADLGIDKLKGLKADQLSQLKDDRSYYLKKALEENKAGDKFGVQLFKGFAQDMNERVKRVEEIRKMLNSAGTINDAKTIVTNATALLDEYIKECPEMAKLLNAYKKYFNDYSGSDKLNKKPLRVGTSVDPNDIAGPLGFTGNGYIENSQQMDYLIRFENKSSAPLAAQIVNVFDTLDLTKFDLNTFELSDISIAGNTIKLPRGRSTYISNYDMRPSLNLIVSIAAKLDTITGIVNWQFVTLDPDTKELTNNPELGFLPPNSTAPEGEGSVSFTVKLKNELANSAMIQNRASIIFDYNEPILTNIWNNKIDNQEPSANVSDLTQLNDSVFKIECNGNDQGSGIRYYNLYCSTNGGEFEDMGLSFSNKILFQGKLNNTYSLCAIAVDSVGNREKKGIIAESSITLKPTKLNEQSHKVELTVFPNPADDYINIKMADAPFVGSYVIQLFDLKGRSVVEKTYESTQIRSGVQLSVSQFAPAQYLLRILYDDKWISEKINLK